VKLIASGNRNRSKPWWASLLSLGAVICRVERYSDVAFIRRSGTL
jgi:hypothetical protein